MGLIHLDAGVVIGLLDADDVRHPAALAALSRHQNSGDRFAKAVSAFAECLVGPARRGQRAIAVVDDFFDRVPIQIVELDAETARGAAALRARRSALRPSDALVIATAVQHSADELVTTDRKWPTERALKVDVAITRL